jgi:hypothetical protein
MGNEMFKVPATNATVMSVVSMPEQMQEGEETKDTDDRPVTKMEDSVDSLSY